MRVLGVAALFCSAAVLNAEEAVPVPDEAAADAPAEAAPLPPVGPGPAVAPSTEEMMERAQRSLQEIDSRLTAAQEKAFESKTVQDRQEELEAMVNKRIIEGDATLEGVLAESKALYDELIAHPEIQNPMAAPSPEVQAKIQEFQDLEMRLAGPRRAVLESDEFMTAQAAFREFLIAEMEKFEPETRQLIARGEAIVAELQAQMGQMQRMPPPPPADAPERD